MSNDKKLTEQEIEDLIDKTLDELISSIKSKLEDKDTPPEPPTKKVK